MLEGMYSAAAGMAAQQHRLDALSNDIANSETTGYKRLRVAFRDLVYTPEGLATQGITEGAGAAAATIGRSAVQGASRRTDRPLDVAILGPGWLRMRRSDGAMVRVLIPFRGSEAEAAAAAAAFAAQVAPNLPAYVPD